MDYQHFALFYDSVAYGVIIGLLIRVLIKLDEIKYKK